MTAKTWIVERDVILHIPHSCNILPRQYLDYFLLSESELQKEMQLLVDAYTDELFIFDGAQPVVFEYPRILVDVERFFDDKSEPMSRVGMGKIYTKTSVGRSLKRTLTDVEIRGLEALYLQHHLALENAIASELKKQGKAIMVDCHSFPSVPLQCDQNQKQPRTQFCIGSDPMHTPRSLVEALLDHIKILGYSVEENDPYEGTLVPNYYFNSNRNVHSVMIEVNRVLYMDESAGKKLSRFDHVRQHVSELLYTIRNHESKGRSFLGQ